MSEYEQTGDGNSFDFESALITSIIDEKNIRQVIKHKITADFFFGTQQKAAFIFLLGWFKNVQYGDTPSWESFQHSFPDFAPIRVEESVIALCDKVREAKLYNDISAACMEVVEQLADPTTAFDSLKKKVVSLAASHTVDSSCSLRSRIDELRTEYFAMKSGSTGLKGLPYPWQALNDSTLGHQEGQLVFLYGRPKSGKTWTALKIVQNLYAKGLIRPVIFSQELSDIEICRRFVALMTGVDYNAYLRGQLDPKSERDFLDDLEALLESDDIIIDMITSQGEDAILEMNTKIDEYRANYCFVDAVYALGQDWKELVAVMSGMKRAAKTKRIQMLGTTQANRSGKGRKADDVADDFAYADAFYQWCDAALRITSDIEHRRNREAVLSTAALREGIPVTFTLNMIMAGNLEQKAVLKTGSDDDIEDQIETDGVDDNPEVDSKIVQPEPPKIVQPKVRIAKPKGLVSVPVKIARKLAPQVAVNA